LVLLIAGVPVLAMPIPVAAGAHGTTRTVRCGAQALCTDGRIQTAINSSVDGDTVLVYPGTYQELVDFGGKSIRVVGVKGANTTTIEGDGKGAVVSFRGGKPREAILEGFTVRHGGQSGILMLGASPIVRENAIVANTDCGDGGGVLIEGGSPLILRNTISGNVAGTAMGCGGYIAGGGIAVEADSNAEIVGNVVVDNTNNAGSGIAVTGGTVRIENNVIEGNSNFDAGGSSGIELLDSHTGTTVTQNLVLMGVNS